MQIAEHLLNNISRNNINGRVDRLLHLLQSRSFILEQRNIRMSKTIPAGSLERARTREWTARAGTS